MPSAHTTPPNALQPVLRAAQYLSGITSDAGIWEELEQVWLHFFQADLFAVFERGAESGLLLRHCSLPAVAEPLSRLGGPIAQEVLDSGFLASEPLALPEPFACGLYPLTGGAGGQVLVIGRRGEAPLDRPQLETDLAVTGLCTSTLSRLDSQRRLRTVTENVPEMLFQIERDAAGRPGFSYLSPGTLLVTGHSAAELRGNPGLFFDALDPPHRERLMAELGSCAPGLRRFSHQLELRDADGARRFLELTAVCNATTGARCVWEGIAQDVTARRLAETELRESEERYRELYEEAPSAYFSLEPHSGVILHCNRAALQLLHAEGDELTGRPIQELLEDDAQGIPVKAGLLEAIHQGTPVQNAELLMRDGADQAMWVELAAAPVHGAGHRLVEYRLAALDIGERKRAEAERNRHARRLQQALVQTIQAVALTVEKRDPYTAGHQQRVAQIAALIGEELGLPPGVIEGLRLGALIHDIGKIAVPVEFLSRPGRLTEIEMELLRGHAEAGYEIVREIDFPWPVAEMIVQHHERLDGSGYPHGLRGDQMVLEARILAVADVFEAMASDRPYRPSLGSAAALEELQRHQGSHYDPEVVAAFERVLGRHAGHLPWEGVGRPGTPARPTLGGPPSGR